MTYANIAAITQSVPLNQRITACAAVEGATKPYGEWVSSRIWEFAATPGWADAWAVSDADDPGADENVITDAMILAAVQAIT